MTCYGFRRLAPAQQLPHALTQRQYRAQRWESRHQGVNRYPCADGGRGWPMHTLAVGGLLLYLWPFRVWVRHVRNQG